MKKNPKIIVVMPAHNAAKTLETSYKKLPMDCIDEIILVDDASSDNTLDVAKKLAINVYRNELNLGYGGNLKICLTKALERGADIIIEYHPDNQYSPENLPIFLEKARQGYDFGLGSRFIHPKEALTRRMPLAKFIANRGLTFIDQFVLGIELSEFHSGFRMYSRKLLELVPYLQNSDDYLFSFEIIVQAVFFNFKIAEVQVSCDYHAQMHTANLRRSTIYALGTFKTLLQYTLSKFLKNPKGPFRKVQVKPCPFCKSTIVRREYSVRDAVSRELFTIYYCTPCKTAFTDPKPKSFAKYYPHTYYSKIKTHIYSYLQYRRVRIINKLLKRGKILDIGCGEGALAKSLDSNLYEYWGIETPFSSTKNSRIKLTGIENMNEKNNSYDMVNFWESFEHIPTPEIALKKVNNTLKKGGFLVIECPRFNSWERYPFGSRWFHLDPPRHVFHYTQEGLKQLLTRHGFETLTETSLYAPEYIPVGLGQSLLYRISPKLNVFAQQYKNKRNLLIPFMLLLISVIMVPFSYIFYLCNGSPIQLIVAQKR